MRRRPGLAACAALAAAGCSDTALPSVGPELVTPDGFDVTFEVMVTQSAS